MADPQKYRLEAKRLRLDAETVHDPEVRNQMLLIAGQYDQIAASIETARKLGRLR